MRMQDGLEVIDTVMGDVDGVVNVESSIMRNYWGKLFGTYLIHSGLSRSAEVGVSMLYSPLCVDK